MDYYEKTVVKRKIHGGNVIDFYEYDILLPDGNKSKRDIVIHPGASVVIPLGADNHIYMVRQFRKPIDMESLELPAGKLDSGEEPEVCAARELKEETGLEAEKLEYITGVHTTPGFSNEILHLFLATGLTEGDSNSDEDEFISCEKYHINSLVDMVYNRQITDAKTIIGILMAERLINKKQRV